MNALEIDEDNFKRINLIVRKPQNGKTGVAISIISNDIEKNTIHIIFTMNTILSGLQFTGRVRNRIEPSEIINFNCKSGIFENCHHAKTNSEVMRLIRHKKIKVIICCSNKARFKDIKTILETCEDSKALSNLKFLIHIDEAHKYIPSFREYIRQYNISRNVDTIFGYTATPDKIFDEKCKDPLFSLITIFNYEKELNIIKSTEYFGVKDTIPCILDDMDFSEDSSITDEIPDYIYSRAGSTSKNSWYGQFFPFKLGDELTLLKFVNYVVNNMTEYISQDSFSYHFIPGYTRRATHYQIGEIILKYFPEANIIIMNMNGIELYRLNKDTNRGRFVAKAEDKNIAKQPEPSDRIQELITKYSNFPTFITGFDCCGMSVTLINENLGNFDTVVYSHEHLQSDDKYQLCRFLFSYQHWKKESKSKIKKTKIYTRTKGVYDETLNYESYIENICDNFLGKTVTLQQLHGEDEYKPSEKERRKESVVKAHEELSKNILNKDKYWKRFCVSDEKEEEDAWEKVRTFYKEIKGKDLKGKSMPKKIENFYNCSVTGNCKVNTEQDIRDRKRDAWHSMFQLTDALNYIRVLVGYEDIDNPYEYTIYVKYVQLKDTPEVHKALKFFKHE